MNRHPASRTVSLGEGTLLVCMPAWNARTFDTDHAEPGSSAYDWPAEKRTAPLTRPSRLRLPPGRSRERD